MPWGVPIPVAVILCSQLVRTGPNKRHYQLDQATTSWSKLLLVRTSHYQLAKTTASWTQTPVHICHPLLFCPKVLLVRATTSKMKHYYQFHHSTTCYRKPTTSLTFGVWPIQLCSDSQTDTIKEHPPSLIHSQIYKNIYAGSGDVNGTLLTVDGGSPIKL